MAIPIPTDLVEFILFGPRDDRRQLQDSPILGDVWVEYAARPGEMIDLLISPLKGEHAGYVADAIDRGLHDYAQPAPSVPQRAARDASPVHPEKDSEIAYVQGLVAARLRFDDLMQVVLPMTYWWHDKRSSSGAGGAAQPAKTAAKKSGAPPEAEFLYWVDQLKDLSHERWIAIMKPIFAAQRIRPDRAQNR